MTDPFKKADDLIKNSPLFSDEGFRKHGSSCSIQSREDFLKRVTQNMDARWDEIKRIEAAGLVPANAKEDWDEYKKTLKDEAFMVVYFHQKLDENANHNINFKGQSKAMGDITITVWTPTAGYPMYISACNSAIKTIGARLNTALKGTLKIDLANMEQPNPFERNLNQTPTVLKRSLWA